MNERETLSYLLGLAKNAWDDKGTNLLWEEVLLVVPPLLEVPDVRVWQESTPAYSDAVRDES